MPFLLVSVLLTSLKVIVVSTGLRLYTRIQKINLVFMRRPVVVILVVVVVTPFQR